MRKNVRQFLMAVLAIFTALVALVPGALSCSGRHQPMQTVDIQPQPPTATVSELPQYAWQSELVDSQGDTGYHASIALKSDDTPCIAYYDATEADLVYAEWNGTAWDIERPDTVGNVGQYCSLAIDGEDNPAISYFDETTWSLKFAARDSMGTWATAVVDGPYEPGYPVSTSLAFDGTGLPAIAYIRPTGGAVSFAKWNGVTWLIETVGSGWEFAPCLAFDSGGHPGITYVVSGPGSFYFAKDSGDGWELEVVSCPYGPVFMDTSLVFDAQDRPWVSFGIWEWGGPWGNDSALIVALRNAGEWAFSRAAEPSGHHFVTSPTLRLSASGSPKVVCNIGADVWSAFRKQSGRWEDLLMSQSARVQGSTTLALDSEGKALAVYRLDTTGDLYLASFEQCYWNETQIVAYEPGLYTGGVSRSSLAFYPSGEPAISFHDDYEYNLQFARWDEQTQEWSIEVVDPTYSAGEQGTSLAFNPEGYPCIAYPCYDDNGGGWSFRLATGMPGGGFVIEQIATTQNEHYGGFLPSLVLDNAGTPSVAWITVDGRYLIYSTRIGGQWIHEVVYYGLEDEEDRMPFAPSLALADQGRPAIAYYDWSLEWGLPTRLSYAEFDPQTSEWVKAKQIDIGQFYDDGPSLAFETPWKPVIAYICSYYNEARLARYNNGEWSTETLLEDYPAFQNNVSEEAGISLFIDDDSDANVAFAIADEITTFHRIAFLTWSSSESAWDLYIASALDAFDVLDVSLCADSFGYPSIAFCGAYDNTQYSKRALRICEWWW